MTDKTKDEILDAAIEWAFFKNSGLEGLGVYGTSKVWFDGEKMSVKHIDPNDFYKPLPTLSLPYSWTFPKTSKP